MTSISDFRRVFVDTSAWIDLMNKNERHHTAAVEFNESLSPIALRVTTWGIVSETFTWIRYHIGAREALRWLVLKETLERQGFLQVVFPDSQMETGIHKVIDRFQNQKLSYVDAFSIALVQTRPDIDAIFAFDHHMTLAGLPVLPGFLR